MGTDSRPMVTYPFTYAAQAERFLRSQVDGVWTTEESVDEFMRDLGWPIHNPAPSLTPVRPPRPTIAESHNLQGKPPLSWWRMVFW